MGTVVLSCTACSQVWTLGVLGASGADLRASMSTRAPRFTVSVTLEELLYLPKPQISHLLNGDNIISERLFWVLTETIHVKNLTQYQVHSKSAIDIGFETSKLELMRLCFPWCAVLSFKNSAFHSVQCCVAAWMGQGVQVSSDGSGKNVKVTQSCPTLCDPWTVQSVEFSRPEYWSG